MKKILLLATIVLLSCDNNTDKKKEQLSTLFEQSNGTKTAEYKEVIDFYIQLAQDYPEINIQTMGETDSGFPLHIVTYNTDADFNFQKIRAKKNLILINNGIHPGESDGIDATMLLYRDLAINKLPAPKNTILVTIPIYNIGGALNRNSTSRTNQNGPEEYGFRGNTQNYDLNRDFIKSDTKNAKAFAEIFHLIKPDVFIDNHVSNGADYQYTLTHLFTQHNKLGGNVGSYLHQQLMPKLEQELAAKNWDITPYVNVFNAVPEKGFSQFMDSPRYSTGYTTLWNTLGMMVETHMLKPYKKRVEGTYELMKSMIAIVENDNTEIKKLRTDIAENYQNSLKYPIQWEIDTTKTATLNFKGYEADTITSVVTGAPRLKYNRNKPFTKKVTYSNYFKAKKEVVVPKAYIIKQGRSKIIELLDLNMVNYTRLEKDSIIEVESYKIASYDTRKGAYEGHYLHYNTTVSKTIIQQQFYTGDFIVETNQPAFRYLLETLEPEAVDSFFNWNFFDTILQQKEGFSPYVFEDIAAEFLASNPKINEAFLAKKEADQAFKNNWYAQLSWIHKKTSNYEKAHLQYPVYRVLKDQ